MDVIGGVAPHAGAWIETLLVMPRGRGDMSLPTRERGLKLPRRDGLYCFAPSLPTRERGLKHGRQPHCQKFGRRSPRGNVD